jgi:hypothetical protein
MALITALGRYHGFDVIRFWWDLAVGAAFSLAIYVLALSLRLHDARALALNRHAPGYFSARPG